MVLLFSFEFCLCLLIKSNRIYFLVSCYFLLNFVRPTWYWQDRGNSCLLFSFEFCYSIVFELPGDIVYLCWLAIFF